MQKTPLNKIGKIGKINLESNKTLKWIYTDYGITRCEMCGADNMLSFAHKHKREWYRSDTSLLSDFKQTLLLCIPCHEKIEYDKKLTDEIFKKLRP